MPIKVRRLGSWIQTRNVLFENLNMNMDFQDAADYSDDPASDFQQAQANIARILNNAQSHGVTGLKRVDEAIKDSDLMVEIAALSAEAKKESDRIQNAVKTVERLAGALDKVTGVVTRIAGLPFVGA